MERKKKFQDAENRDQGASPGTRGPFPSRAKRHAWRAEQWVRVAGEGGEWNKSAEAATCLPRERGGMIEQTWRPEEVGENENGTKTAKVHTAERKGKGKRNRADTGSEPGALCRAWPVFQQLCRAE